MPLLSVDYGRNRIVDTGCGV